MKILHVYKTFINDTMGGTQQVIASIIRNCPDTNIKFSVLSLSPRKTGVDYSFLDTENIHYKEHLSIASNPISFTLWRDYGDIVNQYDLIHYHFPWPFADLINYTWNVKKPIIITYHSDIVRQQKLLYFYKPLMHNFLRAAQTIVATSENYLNTSPVLQIYQDKVQVIPIGINREDYVEPSASRINYWRQRFGDRFFLFIGVMRYYKGLHILLEAVQNSDFPVLIAGSGAIENDLKQYAQKLNLANVHFLGQLGEEDKSALLQLCTSLVFPSNLRSEAFGISLLEGAMFGKALISTELGTGTSYINIDNVTGKVVPPNDAKSLRHAMNYIWDNPDIALQMGREAEDRHKKLFTAQQMARAYTKLYLQTI